MNGERVGEWTLWHENGQVAVTGRYNEGGRDGWFRHYHENGRLEKERFFERDILIKAVPCEAGVPLAYLCFSTAGDVENCAEVIVEAGVVKGDIVSPDSVPLNAKCYLADELTMNI